MGFGGATVSLTGTSRKAAVHQLKMLCFSSFGPPTHATLESFFKSLNGTRGVAAALRPNSLDELVPNHGRHRPHI